MQLGMGILSILLLALPPARAIFFRDSHVEFPEDKEFYKGNFGVDGKQGGILSMTLHI